jgi:hypothetical protein
MGLEGETTITKSDVKTLCDSTKYPTPYQLLPPESKVIVWSLDDPQQQKPLDVYQTSTAQRLSLSKANLAAAQASFTHHNLDNRPKNVEYTFVYGTNHRTEETFYLKGSTIKTKTDNLGDGTVPIWSASFTGTRPGISTWSTPGDHVGILAVQAFKDFLRGYFGMTAALRRRKLRAANVAVLSPDKRVYAPGEAIRLLIIPDQAVAKISSTVRVERYDWKLGRSVQIAGAKQIKFQGGPAKFIPLEIPAPAKPGGYRLTMDGSHKTVEDTHAWFVVSETARRTTNIKRVNKRPVVRRKHKKRS